MAERIKPVLALTVSVWVWSLENYKTLNKCFRKPVFEPLHYTKICFIVIWRIRIIFYCTATIKPSGTTPYLYRIHCKWNRIFHSISFHRVLTFMSRTNGNVCNKLRATPSILLKVWPTYKLSPSQSNTLICTLTYSRK